MSIDITMPRLSDTMETGTVIKWNVKEGDSVEPGDVLADIETDKATMELQAYDEGTVAKILLSEGDEVPVGETIMVLAEEGESEDEAAESAEQPQQAESSKSESKSKSKSKSKSEASDADDADSQEQTSTAVADPERNGRERSEGESNGRIFASPLARKIAEDSGVDLSSLSGSGPSGRIVRKDVEAAIDGGAEAKAPTARRAPDDQRQRTDSGSRDLSTSVPAAPIFEGGSALETETVALSKMRKTIARRLVESKTTVPHYQVTVSADMQPLLKLRGQLNEQLASQNVKLSVNDFLVRACAIAMHQHPFVNSSWKEDESDVAIEIQGDVNIGVAIAIPIEQGGGLVVATLRNADRMGLRGISTETKRLANKAREKGLTIEEMSDSTFTISNLGMFGVEHFTAIINPPNSAILAVGAAIEKPVIKDGELVPGVEMTMTMSSDHRVIDGAMAAQYLNTVKELLEQPASLLV